MKVQFQLVGSLWLAGDSVAMPPGTLRRARATSNVPGPTLRSRDGVDASAGGVSFNGTINSCIRYGTRRFFCDDLGVLGYSNIGVQSGAFPFTGFDGTRLAFVKMPIHETDDYLFIAGGGILKKVGPDGVVSKWGIDAPTAHMNVLSVFGNEFSFFVFETPDTPSAWFTDGESTVTSDATTNSGTSPASMKVVVNALKASTISRNFNSNVTFNLMRFGNTGPLSTVHDYIGFWMKTDVPEALSFIQIDFSIGDDTFGDVYSKLLLPEDPQIPGSPNETVNTGLPDDRYIVAKENVVLAQKEVNERIPGDTHIHVNPKAHTVTVKAPLTTGFQTVQLKADTWKHVRIPKTIFDRNINGTTLDWDNVHAIRITISNQSNDVVTLHFDSMQLEGGYGLQGRYQYYETFENSTTGSRSNPTDVPISVPNSFGNAPFAANGPDFDGVVYRAPVRLGKFASTDDPQVDMRNIWRTVGDGALPFLVDTISIEQGEFLDTIADYEELGRFHNIPGLGTVSCTDATATLSNATDYLQINVGAVINVSAGESRTVTEKLGSSQVKLDATAIWTTLTFKYQNAVVTLQPEQLLLDNDPPADTYEDAFGPFAGAMWWCRDSAAGAGHIVYYSPPGRPEAVLGFIEPTHTDDATQKLMAFNGSLFVFTGGRIIQIFGEQEPFTSREVGDCPGTTSPHTVTLTPYGIVYRAEDGYRLFDGQNSTLISIPLGALVRGKAVDEFAAFEGVIATYARDEYLVSDTLITLAYNGSTQMWRELGLGLDALWHDKERNEILAADDHAYFLLEAPGKEADVDPTTSAQATIPFQVELSPVKHPDQDRIGLVRRIFIEANCNGETLSPTLVLDGVVIELNDITGTGRKSYEFTIERSGQVMAVRISGSLLHPVEITRVSADVRFGDEMQ